MLPFLRKKPRPQTDAEILQQAFEEVGAQQKRRGHRKRHSLLWRRYAEPRMLAVPAIVLIALIANGVRHENMEFYATVIELTGSGTITAAKGEVQTALALEQRIADGGTIATGANCYVALDFPDGSVITLGPSTSFVVELIEYNRGGMWRGRSFSLYSGEMWARVSPKFGSESNCRVHTPSSVAAVRGTRFCMFYDPNRRETTVACNDGLVSVDGFVGRSSSLAGGGLTEIRYSAEPGRTEPMDNTLRASFGAPTLTQAIEPDSWLKRTTMKLTSILDLPLSVLGIGKSSWAIGAANYARTNAALENMRKLHTAIEGYASYPEVVDPFTLAELDFTPEEAGAILRNFDGRSLVSYRRTDQGFVMYARARDRDRTPFMLTSYGVERITEEQMP